MANRHVELSDPVRSVARTSAWPVVTIWSAVGASLLLAPVVLTFAYQEAGSPQSGRLVVEPAPCPDVPAGAVRLHVSGTTHNKPPLMAGTPDFPHAFCTSLTENWPDPALGAVRGYLTSDATMTGEPVGTAAMHAEACLFGPPPTVVPAMALTDQNGDTLNLVARAPRAANSPPSPANESSGRGEVTGGTGKYAGASGMLNLNAKSHGDLLLGTNVATVRDIDLCGYVFLVKAP
jgi:hypothetical protein